jgi:hypothetical protein
MDDNYYKEMMELVDENKVLRELLQRALDMMPINSYLRGDVEEVLR